MKIKTILSAVVTACATLMLSVAVSAATDIKVGTISELSPYIVVPIEVASTDITELQSYDITINFDSSKYTPVLVDDALKYQHAILPTQLNYGSLSANVNYGPGQIRFNWYMNNADKKFPAPSADGTVIANVYFTPNGDYSKNDFTITVNKISQRGDFAQTCTSYFTFDVTGDLGGNRVVALGASTDGGTNIQPLEYYTTTNYTEGMKYADATTTFLVAVNNNSGADEVVDITIYGQLENGKYIPLTTYDQSNFLVQDFK